jgi:hypothetical protein
MRLYIQYVESQHSEADKGISLNANWNQKRFSGCLTGDGCDKGNAENIMDHQ